MHRVLSKRIIRVGAEERLSGVGKRLTATQASHCIVIEKPEGTFLGIVRVEEAIRNSPRIFADLLSPVPVVRLEGSETVDLVAERFEKRKLRDAALINSAGQFLGVITRETANEWRTRNVVSRLQRDVLQKKRELVRTLSALDNISYAVSHDLRTPLRAIKGYAEAAETDFGPRLAESARDYINRMQAASHRLDQLSTGLLAFAKVARRELVITKLNVRSLFRDADERFQPVPPGVSIVSETDSLRVLADRKLLGETLDELIRNAVHHGRNEGALEIRLQAKKHGRRVRLSVSDNGAGISEVRTRGLFELFGNASGSPRDQVLGSGLAVVREALKRMGGEVGVSTEAGLGCTIWMDLPSA